MDPRSHFEQVWACDFEFVAEAGERPSPVCLVARELRSNLVIRLWQNELRALKKAPFGTGPNCLFVAYFASAELGCFLSLDWDLPERILDLYCEFKTKTSGLQVPCGNGLLGALSYHGIFGMDATEKDTMRQLIMRGGPFSNDECRDILEYCQSDVDSLARLLPAMAPDLDLPRALLRGRYMAAVAKMEYCGIPIDTVALNRIKSGWDSVKDTLIQRVDQQFGIYQDGCFKVDRFEALLKSKNISWPRLTSGKLALDDDSFREMAKMYPELAPVRELRSALSQMRLNELAVGMDGRNRCLLSPFGSRTGRNQPSNTKFVFGPSVWLRSLIRPATGRAIAYIDWSQQELAIAARLSGDTNMQDAYNSGDFYLNFAKMANAVPPNATKETHAAVREQFKTLALGVQYGLSAEGLSRKLGVPPVQGRELLKRHKDTFRQFWEWSDKIQDEAMLSGRLQTVFGWTAHAGGEPNPRSLRNFPMQANGAEMMRLACCLVTERGIQLCCPVHDALLIEAGCEEIDQAVAATRDAMQEASEIVLEGFSLRTDAKIVRSPDRYSDKRGEMMWATVAELCGVDQ